MMPKRKANLLVGGEVEPEGERLANPVAVGPEGLPACTPTKSPTGEEAIPGVVTN